jgi:hypothetical protein
LRSASGFGNDVMDCLHGDCGEGLAEGPAGRKASRPTVML